MITADQVRDQARALYDDYHIEYVGSFGEFGYPSGMAIRNDGCVCVCDYPTGKIFLFSFDGKPQGVIETKIKGLARIDFDCERDCIYACGRHSNIVYRLDYQGNILGNFETNNKSVFQFQSPADIHVSGNGSIAVTDMVRNSIEIFDSDGIHQKTYPIANQTGSAHAITSNADSLYITMYDNSGWAGDGPGLKKSRVLAIDNNEVWHEISLQSNKSTYFHDIIFHNRAVYLTDGDFLFKYSDSFELIFKLNLAQLVDPSFYSSSNEFSLVSIADEVMFVAEGHQYKTLFSFKIS